MMTMLLLGLILGLGLGFAGGRRWAEMARARHDMNQAWQGRTRYRRR